MVQAEKWKDTLKQATGEVVVEDKSKLRKALKRREAAKKKSAVKWDQIMRDQSTAKEERLVSPTSNHPNVNPTYHWFGTPARKHN